MKVFLSSVGRLVPVLAFLLVSIAPGAAKGSQEDRAYVDDYDNTNFTQIELNSGIRMEYSPSSFYSIKVYGKARDLDQLAVTQIGHRLKVGWKSVWPGRQDLRLVITAPDLERLTLASGCQAVLELESSRELEAELGPGACLNGRIRADKLLLKLSAGSRAAVSGACSELDLEASAGAQMEAPQFSARSAVFDLSAGAQAYLEIQDTAEVNASTGARLRYRGDPQVKLHLSTGAHAEQVR